MLSFSRFLYVLGIEYVLRIKDVKTLSSVNSSKQVRPIKQMMVVQCGRPNNGDLYKIFPGFRRLPNLAWVEELGGSRIKESFLS